MHDWKRTVFLIVLMGLQFIPLPGRADPVTDRLAGVLADLDAVSAADLETPSRAAAFLQIVARAFDLDRMALASLSPEDLPEPEAWDAYQDAYLSHTVQTFLQKLAAYGPTVSTPVGLRIAQDGAQVFVFRSQAGGRTTQMGWVLCPDGSLRICDVEIYGIRASSYQGRQFARALARLGWEGFLADLQGGALVPPG
ncbi:MAG: ABC transporter substrate-binding protein [Rhodobacter sp.]|nr:ABC transporter substrate-binding protein [Paracoccaceae bacterium]MCC0078316.1 ABC transporter substrate-binding protein [Rhodobacter sp.]